LNEHSHIDVAIDGADQIDGDFNLVKGGGGALLREKMVEMAATTFIVIADSSKVVDQIGPGFPIPVRLINEE
jgi:ribose 5-phosphate isomerase A